MRLLLVNSAWPAAWGGGEKWFVTAARWLADHGHVVRLVARPGSRLLRAAREGGVDAITTPFGGDFDPLAVARARRIIFDFAPEAVLVNFNKEAFHFGLAARKTTTPVIARHGFPLWRRPWHHRYLARRLLSGLIVNAAALWEHYRALGIAPRYVAVIPNGVECVETRSGELRQRFGIASDQRMILAAGRLEEQKRFDRVIEIVARLRKDRPDLVCLIAGEGPLRSTLEAQIRSRSLAEHVRLIGFVENLAELCGDADLFLLTSDQEGTPNVLLEAMAAAVPCLAFAVGSVPQILAGDLSGSVFQVGDVNAMAARAAVLLDDPVARADLGRRQAVRVVTDFSFDSAMHRYEDVLQQIMAAVR